MHKYAILYWALGVAWMYWLVYGSSQEKGRQKLQEEIQEKFSFIFESHPMTAFAIFNIVAILWVPIIVTSIMKKIFK